MSAYNQRSWGSGPGDQPFSAHSIRVLPTCRQEATPYLLPSAPSRAHCPALPCLAQPYPALPHLGMLCQEWAGRAVPASLVGRDSGKLWGPVFGHVIPGVHMGPLGIWNRRVREGRTPAVLLCWSSRQLPTLPHPALWAPESAD